MATSRFDNIPVHRVDELERVVTAVEAETGIRADSILGRSRVPAVCRARHLLMWRLRQIGDWSLNEIGRAVGLHHTTVIYGLHQEAKRRSLADAHRGVGGAMLPLRRAMA